MTKRSGGRLPGKGILASQRGSVLLFVLAFGAILGVVAISLSGKINSALDMQKNRVAFNEYSEMIDSLRNQLEDPMLCAQMLGGQAFNPTQVQSSAGQTLNRINTRYGTLNTAPITPGWEVRPGGVRVERIAIKMRTGAPAPLTPFRTVQIATDPARRYQAYRGEVYIYPSNPRVNLLSDNRAHLRIPLTFLVSGNTVRGCHGDNSQAGQCMVIGGAFDWGPSPGGAYSYPAMRCHPDIRCFYSASGVVNNPSSCVAPYQAQSIGVFFDASQSRYVCRWCNPYTSP